MPSYTIHLAVALRYLENTAEEDSAEFLRGVIAPDMLKKPESHYGPASSEPGTRRYIEECGLDTAYRRGYYMHLLTDKLFYGEYLTRFSTEIYKDYDKLNAVLVKRYGIDIPEEIKDVVSFTDGETVLLDESVFDFIDIAGEMGLKEDYPDGEVCFRMAKRASDKEAADKWLRRAAEKGHPEAIKLI